MIDTLPPEDARGGKNPRILILGVGVMQGPALKIASEMGLEVVAADADPSGPCVSLADRFYKVDLKDKEGIEALGKALMESGGLAGIMTAGTDFSATVAWASGRLDLPGIPYETALDASDKERMRRRFRAAGVPSPEFFIIDSVPKEGTILPFSWPAVVKPVDSMGSRGCRRVDNFAELCEAAGDALEFSRSGRAIVEELMDGPEYSVDALVYEGEIAICGIADRHIFFPPYFIEMGHTMPAAIADAEDPEKIKLLLDVFIRGVRALGIDNGAAKGDIKLTSRGPMIGEIAARLSGGYMSGWTYPYSSGVMPTRGAIEIAIGRKPSQTRPEWNQVSAERAFISIPGKVASISGVEKARAMPGIKDVFLRVRAGSEVDFPRNNVSKCGNVISAAASRKEAVDCAENAARSILLRLEVPNAETDAFLAIPPGGGGFPPDAFNLDARQLSLLSAKKGDCHLFDGLRDCMGRSISECLEAVSVLTGVELAPFLGRSFWQALIRGGYQGAAYYIDSMKRRKLL